MDVIFVPFNMVIGDSVGFAIITEYPIAFGLYVEIVEYIIRS